ncbi:hypothetical protein B0H63DRAFT_192370 [Podospora didyma]|uniref:G-protein coupled receptors family 2 profile 2 domain-containing protein n=1 Tax=Podospora didyma TaxID=330526 RepID=A0AAE0NR18_9PEZI|nr:hypothetical protein B0H63DRAFT_192370 [Podospora didyma]
MGVISPEEAEAIIYIERVCSVFSLLGCLFVLVTFSCSDAFRQRSINRLVFLATFGNMLTNVATLMTTSFTPYLDSFGCQLQAFLIQVFMQGDAYWALAMAINVYLTFYHKYDARSLRKMEIPYFLCCYGIPFIPGFTFLFISNENGRPYGDAVLWCWLKPKWEIYRIATFYGPVWVAIVITMAIYIRAGQDIYRKRRKVLHFSGSGTGTFNNSEPYNPANDLSSSFKTTEVVQTTEIVRSPAAVATASRPAAARPPSRDPSASYTVTISADTNQDDRDSLDAISETTVETGRQGASSPTPTRPTTTVIQTSNTSHMQSVQARRRHFESTNAVYSYTKCAILFFSVLLITWIPSSGNRVYSMINGGAVSKPLFFASAFVLPLQGFWNAIIYMVTSWSACKTLYETVRGSLGGSRGTVNEITIISRHRDSRPMGGKWGKAEESTSMEDLTGSRSHIDHISPV